MRAAIAAAMLILAAGCEHQPSVPPARAPAPAPTVAPSASAEVVSEPSTADPVEAVFAAAATMVDAAKDCTDTCCRDRLSPWRILRPHPPASLDEREVLLRLRSLLESDAEPRSHALAMIWLSAWQLPMDVERFEARLDDARPAWAQRQVNMMSQGGRVCEPISAWKAKSVSDIALEALSHTLGRQFRNVDAYRQWRAGHGAVEDSVSYWSARLPIRAAEPRCALGVKQMAQRDPRLMLALAVRRRFNHPKDASRTCPQPSSVRAAFTADPQYDSALDLLRSPSRWLDREARSWADVAAWVLLHAEELLDAEDAGAVEALVGQPQFHGDEIKGLAIVAAARLDSARRIRLLRRWVDQLGKPPAAFFTLYAATFPTDRRILPWLRPEADDQCWFERRARAVLAGLTEAGTPSKAVLARHFRDPGAQVSERVILVGLLADTVVAQGAPERDFVCRKGLRRRKCLKTSLETARVVEAAVARDLPACLSALSRWLGP